MAVGVGHGGELERETGGNGGFPLKIFALPVGAFILGEERMALEL